MTPLFLDLKSVQKLHCFEMRHSFCSGITYGFHIGSLLHRARVDNLMETLQVININIFVLLFIVRKQRDRLFIKAITVLLILVGKQLVTPILKVLIGLIKRRHHNLELLILLRLQLKNNIGQFFIFRLKLRHFLQF